MVLSNKLRGKFFLIFAILLLLFAIVLNPQTYISACLNGILIWGTIVLPALLPFMFFTKTLTELGIADALQNKFQLIPKIFKVPACATYVFVMSVLSGYPVGAKILSDLYETGVITQTDAYKISTFTSNSGPMFILGSVGIGMLGNKKLGIIILISHIIGAIFNGLLYRNYNKNNISNNIKKNKIETAFNIGNTMWDTARSVLIVGGFIAIFFVIIEILNNLNVFLPFNLFLSKITGLPPNIFNAIFNGFFEITRGCKEIAMLNLGEMGSAIICTGIITFGGLATALQAITFLKKFNMSLNFFLKQKITHTIFACAVCFLLILIF